MLRQEIDLSDVDLAQLLGMYLFIFLVLQTGLTPNLDCSLTVGVQIFFVLKEYQ